MRGFAGASSQDPADGGTNPMPETKLGKQMVTWSADAKKEFAADLNKVTKLPSNVLQTVLNKIAKTYPACNAPELAALEAEQSGIDQQTLTDAVSVFTYIWQNAEGESAKAITADLESLGLVTKAAMPFVADLLTSAEPLRETAIVESSYIRIGAPLFVGIRGTVDLRLRFHNTDNEFSIGVPPTKLLGAKPVIMVNLTTTAPGNKDRIVSFVMDENDLNYMKRFVKHMERELELSNDVLKSSSERKGHG